MSKKTLAAALAFGAVLIGVTSAGAAVTADLFGDTGVGSYPTELAIDASGNIYTANGNNSVSKVTSSGAVTAQWGTSSTGFTLIATAPDGSVYAGTDTSANIYR